MHSVLISCGPTLVNKINCLILIFLLSLTPSTRAGREKLSPSIEDISILKDYSSDGGGSSSDESDESSSYASAESNPEDIQGTIMPTENIDIEDGTGAVVSIPEETLTKVVTRAYKNGARFASTLFASVVNKARRGNELVDKLWAHPPPPSPPASNNDKDESEEEHHHPTGVETDAAYGIKPYPAVLWPNKPRKKFVKGGIQSHIKWKSHQRFVMEHNKFTNPYT